MAPIRPHVAPTLMLALPLIGSHLARMAIGVTDTLLVARLGVDSLAALVLATSLFLVVYMAGSGYAMGLMARVADALARGEDTEVRRATRMALWLSILHSAVMAPLMWHSGAVLTAFEQEPQVAALAQEWLRVMLFAMAPVLCAMTLNSYLAALGRAGIVMWITVLGLPLNALFNWLLIFGPGPFPAWGITGAGIASLVVNWLQFGALALFAAWLPAARRFDLFRRFWKPDWTAMREIFVLGLPIGLTTVAEIGMFAGTNLMMGWFGPEALAAHGIALQLASIAFMVHIGLSNAGTIRIGAARGAGDREGLRAAAATVMLMSVAFAALTMAFFILTPGPLAWLYLNPADPAAPRIVAMAAVLMVYAGAFQIVDAMQVVGLGLLRGVQDTRVPLVLTIVSYWLIGMPAAYFLALHGGMGPQGLWAGLCVGLTAAAALLLRRFWARGDGWISAGETWPEGATRA